MYKRQCTKECFTVYVKRRQTTEECVRQEGRSSENEREECRKRERGYLWLSTREKFSPYRQVGHAANMHNNKEGIGDGNNCTCRLIYDNGDYKSRYNRFPVDTMQLLT